MSEAFDNNLAEWRNPIGIRVAQMHYTEQPIDDFSFGLEGPRDGWLFFHLILGQAGRFVCRVSGMPNDFLRDMVESLGQLAVGRSVAVRMHAEPNTFIMHLAPLKNEGLAFKIVHHTSFEAVDSPTQVVGFDLAKVGDLISALIYVLNDFMAHVPDTTYRQEMGHEFPRRELESLNRLVGHA
jgi:hypothetical protein